MARRIEVRTGAGGYRDQLDRVRRFRDRVVDREGHAYVIDYQDDVWSFFQNCWHLKDWVKHDPLIPADKKAKIIAAVEDSTVLAIASDMANGTKHRELYKPRVGAYYSFTQIHLSGEQSLLETVIEADGIPMTANTLAQLCVEEWEKILSAEGLPIEPLGT